MSDAANLNIKVPDGGLLAVETDGGCVPSALNARSATGWGSGTGSPCSAAGLSTPRTTWNGAGRPPGVRPPDRHQLRSDLVREGGRFPGEPARRGRELTMAVAVTLDKALDKAYENKSLEEILDAPVAALAGVSDGDAEKLAAAFGIKTVRDLGSSKYFAVAQALVALGAHSG
jgi:hypothetical protein